MISADLQLNMMVVNSIKGANKLYEYFSSSKLLGFVKVRTTHLESNSVYLVVGSNDMVSFNPHFSEIYNLIAKLIIQIVSL